MGVCDLVRCGSRVGCVHKQRVVLSRTLGGVLGVVVAALVSLLESFPSVACHPPENKS
jgi:hypothetical protein